MSPPRAGPYRTVYNKRAMPIRLAHELAFSPAPRCPHVGARGAECGLGILPYGRSEPFAVDAQGRVYCRTHGAEVEPMYEAAHAAWQENVKAKRLRAIQALEEEAADPALPA
jgi:hypothetical protein